MMSVRPVSHHCRRRSSPISDQEEADFIEQTDPDAKRTLGQDLERTIRPEDTPRSSARTDGMRRCRLEPDEAAVGS